MSPLVSEAGKPMEAPGKNLRVQGIFFKGADDAVLAIIIWSALTKTHR